MDIKHKNKGGRPAGRKKTDKIEVSIEPEVKKKFMNMLHTEGKTASVQICEWIKKFIIERDIEHD